MGETDLFQKEVANENGSEGQGTRNGSWEEIGESSKEWPVQPMVSRRWIGQPASH